jgi:hypothetical protein
MLDSSNSQMAKSRSLTVLLEVETMVSTCGFKVSKIITGKVLAKVFKKM